LRPPQRQQGHDLAVLEPLAGHAAVWLGAAQAGGHGLVRVRADLVGQPEFVAGGAAFAFADHRERSGRGFRQALDAALEMHGMGQSLFQRRNVHDPGQRLAALVDR